ncbi:MAG: diacylglycerol/lipid kinase family protein [Flavisolibacter sp.]
MERHLIYIINPISGTKKKTALPERIRTRMQAANLSYEIYPSAPGGDYTFLEKILSTKKVTDIIIAGGDGTLNQAIHALHRFDLRFGILPCGSGNGLALSAGIPRNLDKALDIIIRGNWQWTDAFLVNDRFACMLCGLGFDAQVAKDFAEDPNRGLLTYIKQTVKNFFSARAYPFKILVQGKELSTEAFFISIANSNQFGNNFTIAPKASLTDGLLDIVVMCRQSKWSLLFQTLRQVGGFNRLESVEVLDRESSLLYFQTTGLRILNPKAAPMHIDGDPVSTSRSLDVRLLNGCFRLLRP